MTKARWEQREKILDAAGNLFAERGIENTTLWDIARQVEANDIQILRLFGMKKENILLEIYKRVWDTINRRVQEIKADPTLTAKRKLALLYEMFLQEIKNFGLIGHTFITHLKKSGELGGEIIRAGSERFAGLIDDIIQEGQQAGLFKQDMNVQAFRQQIIGCIENTLIGWIWKDQASYPADYTPEDAIHIFENIRVHLDL